MSDEGVAAAIGSDTVRAAINTRLVSFDDSYRNAGISRFIYTLLEGLAALDSGHEYTAFMSPKAIRSALGSPIARARAGTSRHISRLRSPRRAAAVVRGRRCLAVRSA